MRGYVGDVIISKIVCAYPDSAASKNRTHIKKTYFSMQYIAAQFEGISITLTIKKLKYMLPPSDGDAKDTP